MTMHRLSLVSGEEVFESPTIVFPGLGLRGLVGRTAGSVSKAISLRSLASETQPVLFKAATVFPFDLFPDGITFDDNKVNVVKRGLLSKQIHSILIEDITEVTVDTLWFLGTLELTDSTNPRFPWVIRLSPMWASEAARARRILQGLIKAKRLGLDFASCDKKELCREMEKLGEAKEEE